ncbi:MAG: cobalamin B12-binding domain-containing protein, partial [Ruminococcaceae bacterium]|nr:cobalamin B12-binding domain-containing protein [Oscillospiraceae bacterium]
MKGKILAGALGNCVHVAGVVSILRQAEELGYETVFLGAAVPVDEFIEAIHEHDPDIVGVSYRLSPEVAESLLADFADKLSPSDRQRRFAFGGTPPVCLVAEQTDLFERCFDGLEHMGETIAWLGGRSECLEQHYCDSLGERIAASGSIPLLRHHFGLPDFEQTRAGIEEIAAARVLDVISL